VKQKTVCRIWFSNRVTVSSLRVAFVVILFLVASSEPIRPQSLYVIERDDLYGFSDNSGKPVIPPRYDAVKPFSEGLAPVYENGNWGFIDSEGKMKIEPDFPDVDNFSDGFAAIHKGGWGYIDRTGRIVVQPRYFQAGRFSEEVAPVEGEAGWFFIDKAGSPVHDLSGFEDAKNFSGGLAAIQVGSKWRFVTHDGKKKFDLEFTKVSNFSENLAAVEQAKNGKYGFIDSAGHYAIKPVFEDAKPFSEGLAAVRLNKRWAISIRAARCGFRIFTRFLPTNLMAASLSLVIQFMVLRCTSRLMADRNFSNQVSRPTREDAEKLTTLCVC